MAELERTCSLALANNGLGAKGEEARSAGKGCFADMGNGDREEREGEEGVEEEGDEEEEETKQTHPFYLSSSWYLNGLTGAATPATTRRNLEIHVLRVARERQDATEL